MTWCKSWMGIAFALVCGVLIGLDGARSASAQDRSVHLRVGHWVAERHPIHGAFQAWLQSIGQASGQTISGTILPAEQAGPAPAHFELVRTGAVDIAFVNPGFQRARFPYFSAGELPLLVGDAVRGSKAFDAWYRPIAAREMAEVRYCASFLFGPATPHGTGPLLPAATLSGRNVRPTHPGVGLFLASLGMVEVRGRAEDIRAILVEKRAETATFPWGSVGVFGLTDVLTHHLDLPLYVTPFTLLMNQAAYERMSPNQRRVIDDHCSSDWAGRLAEPFAALEARGRAALATMPGHVIEALSAAERAHWLAQAAHQHDAWLAGQPAAAQAQAALAGLKAALQASQGGIAP